MGNGYYPTIIQVCQHDSPERRAHSCRAHSTIQARAGSGAGGAEGIEDGAQLGADRLELLGRKGVVEEVLEEQDGGA